MNTIDKLNALAELNDERTALALRKQAIIDSILTPEIKAQIASVELEFAPELEAADKAIAALTDEVKADVISGGATIKGDRLQAVWSKGRVSWDSKMLDGMSKLLPQLNEARSEGEPSVSIRAVKS